MSSLKTTATHWVQFMLPIYPGEPIHRTQSSQPGNDWKLCPNWLAPTVLEGVIHTAGGETTSSVSLSCQPRELLSWLLWQEKLVEGQRISCCGMLSRKWGYLYASLLPTFRGHYRREGRRNQRPGRTVSKPCLLDGTGPLNELTTVLAACQRGTQDQVSLCPHGWARVMKSNQSVPTQMSEGHEVTPLAENCRPLVPSGGGRVSFLKGCGLSRVSTLSG